MTSRRALWAAGLCLTMIGCAKPPTDMPSAAPSPPAAARPGAKPDRKQPAAGKVQPPQPVSLKSADGVVLDGGWRPATTKAKAGLVLVPMLGRTHEDYAGFSQALAGYNIASLAVSLRGHGKSQAPGGKGNNKFGTDDWKKARADIAAAVANLRDRVGQAPVVVVGASIGANLAVLYASEQPDKVQGLVLLSPGLDYHGVTITEPFGKLKSKPTLVINAADDNQAVPGGKLQPLHDPTKWSLLQYDGNEHGTDLLAKHPQIVSKLIDWLGKLR